MSEASQPKRMFFQGGTCSVDGQGRIFLPKSWRLATDDQNTQFILVPSFDKSIAVYALEDFFALYNDKFMRARQDAVDQNWVSLLSDWSQTFSLDKQGRFVISEKIRRYAGIKEKVECVGTYSYGRLFSPEHWAEVKLRNKPEPEPSPEQEETLPNEEREFLNIRRALRYLGSL